MWNPIWPFSWRRECWGPAGPLPTQRVPCHALKAGGQWEGVGPGLSGFSFQAASHFHGGQSWIGTACALGLDSGMLWEILEGGPCGGKRLLLACLQDSIGFPPCGATCRGCRGCRAVPGRRSGAESDGPGQSFPGSSLGAGRGRTEGLALQAPGRLCISPKRIGSRQAEAVLGARLPRRLPGGGGERCGGGGRGGGEGWAAEAQGHEPAWHQPCARVGCLASPAAHGRHCCDGACVLGQPAEVLREVGVEEPGQAGGGGGGEGVRRPAGVPCGGGSASHPFWPGHSQPPPPMH